MPKCPTPRRPIFQPQEVKKKLLTEVGGGRSKPIKETKIKLYLPSSPKKSCKQRREQNEIFCVESQNHNDRILYPEQLPLKSEGKIKTCSRQTNWRELLPIDLPYKKCFKMLFYRERN